MQDEASALYSFNLAQYGGFKARLLAATGALVAAGGSVALVAGGMPAALPFLAGGATGAISLPGRLHTCPHAHAHEHLGAASLPRLARLAAPGRGVLP
jgi:hypothetical protein